MATDVGEKTYLSHTAQQVDDAIDAVATKASTADLSVQAARIDVLKATLKNLIDNGPKNKCLTDVGSGTDYSDTACSGLKAGTWEVSFAELETTATGATTCLVQALNGNTVVSEACQVSVGQNVHATITLTGAANKIRVYATDTTSSSGATVSYTDIMICTTSDWSISQEFVLYCPTIKELYDMILNS